MDRISLSQFMHGVSRRLTIREGKKVKQVEIQVDRGTGLGKSSVRRGLQRAVEHGYLLRYMVCGMCEEEILDQSPPRSCPHCQHLFKGQEQYYYSLYLRSPTLDALPREARFSYLRDLGRDGQDFFATLHELCQPDEGTVPETATHEPGLPRGEGRRTIVELLSTFGFTEGASEAAAGEALDAGLTAEDVTRWIAYVDEQTSLDNPRGFLRAKLRSGEDPPPDDGDRYISGKYADYIKY